MPILYTERSAWAEATKTTFLCLIRCTVQFGRQFSPIQKGQHIRRQFLNASQFDEGADEILLHLSFYLCREQAFHLIYKLTKYVYKLNSVILSFP